MPRVVCAGHVNWDVTLRIGRLPEPDGEATIRSQRGAGGGSAANAAVSLAGLGVDATVLGSVGEDEHGERAERELTEAGVDAHLVTAEAPTAVKYLVVAAEGEVMVFGNDGANEAFVADDLPEGALADADHLHLTGQDPGTAAALADRAGSAGVGVSFDPGRKVHHREDGAVLDRVDTVFLNRREADGIADLARLRADAELVVTEGAGGAELLADGERITHPGFEVDPADTTGSGDAFVAGFLAARLRGADDERALAVANASGALAARTVGARCDVSSEDVDALLDGESVD